MTALNAKLPLALRGLLLAALFSPMTPLAASSPGAPRVLDNPVERRIELLIGSSAAGEGFVVGMPRAVTLHRFYVEFTDAAGRPIRGFARWSVALTSGATAVAPEVGAVGVELIAQLSAESPELRMPRPFGVRLAASDTLVIVATLEPGAVPADAFLRLTLEYESESVARTRLPVRALAPRPALGASSPGNTSASSWDLQSEIGGRLVAISSPALACATSLVIEDAESGAVLWRMRPVATVPTLVSVQRSDVIRPAVLVAGGRLYRLHVEYGPGPQTSCGDGTPTAMILGT
jgi:hypothetical protein